MSSIKKLFIFVIILVLLALHPPSAFAEKKVALVIGNSDYTHVQALKNPANDAKAISALFTKLGYDVRLVLDADRAELAKALGDFSQISMGTDSAIFYYAGHGLSLENRNYLVPIDSDIERASDVKLGGGFDAETAIDEALSDAKVKLVFLDACRDNPFVEQIKRSLSRTRSTAISSGLAEMKSGAGTLIAFSTAPGQVALDGEGENSPFAEALIKHLSEPGLEIRLAMTKVRADVEASTDGKQTPWESTNLTGFYYFKPRAAIGNSENMNSDNSLTSTSPELDLEYWKSVKDSSDPALLNTYIKRFPRGVYRDLAESKLKIIEDKGSRLSLSGEGNVATPSLDESALAKRTEAKSKPETQEPTSKGGARAQSPASKKTKSTTSLVVSKRRQPVENETAKDSNGGGSDQSSYLAKLTRMNSAVWSVPPGATIIGPKSARNFRVLYKGREYRCHPGGLNRVICKAQ